MEVKYWSLVIIGLVLCGIGSYLIFSNYNQYMEAKQLFEYRDYALNNKCVLLMRVNDTTHYDVKCIGRDFDELAFKFS